MGDGCDYVAYDFMITKFVTVKVQKYIKYQVDIMKDRLTNDFDSMIHE